MNNNKVLYIIIVVLLLIIVGGGAFLLGSNKAENPKTESSNQPVVQDVKPVIDQQGQQDLSEQPNKQKFSEYFTEAAVAKLPAGAEFNPFAVQKTSIFNVGEQFCTTLSMKKQIPPGHFATAVYDVNAKQDVQPKSAFPQNLGPGGSVGCENLSWSIGKYEYKMYVDDVLAVVSPFEVK